MERKFPPLEKITAMPQPVVYEANVEIYMNRLMDEIIRQIQFSAAMGLNAAHITPRTVLECLRQTTEVVVGFISGFASPDSFRFFTFVNYDLKVALERVIEKLNEAYPGKVNVSDTEIVINLK